MGLFDKNITSNYTIQAKYNSRTLLTLTIV